jgi:hypothetical protein
MGLTFENIDKIDAVTSSKGDRYIKFDMGLRDGKKASLVAEYGQYCKWVKKNKGAYDNIFGDFVKDFLVNSNESEEDLSEIVDKDGNLYPDQDMPNNATNRMVGSSKFDLDKVYRQTVPMGSRYYSGDMGVGVVTW